MTIDTTPSAREGEPRGDGRADTLTAPGRVTRDALEGLYATGHWLYSRSRYRDASAVFRVMVLCLPDEERGYLALGA